MAGRPKAIIDWTKVDNYLKAQCNGTGIASILGICPDVLYNDCKVVNKMDFSAYSAIKKGEGKELLRAKQFQSAMEGDRVMQIWLGKQYLEQKDKSDVTTDNKPLQSNEVTITDEQMDKFIEALKPND